MNTAKMKVAILSSILAAVVLTGCGRKEPGQSKPAEVHSLKGQVVALDPKSSLITIAHERMPGFMEAMTMPFTVKDTTLLRGVEVGDSVRGVVMIQRPEVWLDSLVVVWKMPPSEPSR